MNRRYPGLNQFREIDNPIFFGRHEEIRKLTRLIEQEKVILVYGASGTGKSSLLRAGLIPSMNDKCIFFSFTFKKIENTIEDSIEEFRNQIFKQLEYYEIEKSEDLWMSLKRVERKTNKDIVFLFDQFEDIFQFENEYIFKLVSLLNKLQSDLPSEAFLDDIDNVPIEKRNDVNSELFLPLNIKYVFVVRSDKIDELYTIKDYIPNIHNNEFLLRPLSVENAKKALKNPSNFENIFTKNVTENYSFQSDPFEISDELIDKIIDKILIKTNIKSKSNKEVSTVQLQIVASEIESFVISEKKATVDSYNFPLEKIDNSIRNFYNSQLTNFYNKEKIPEIRQVLEEYFVFENVKTPIAKSKLLSKLDSEDIAYLISSKIIKEEVTSSNIVYYELLHDSLVAPIEEDKNEKKQREELLRIEKYYKEQKEKIAKQYRMIIAYVIIGVLLLVSIFVIYQMNKHNEELSKSNEQLTMLNANDMNVAFSDFLNGRIEKSNSVFFKAVNNDKFLEELGFSKAEANILLQCSIKAIRANNLFMKGDFGESMKLTKEISDSIPKKYFNKFPALHSFLKKRTNEINKANNIKIKSSYLLINRLEISSIPNTILTANPKIEVIIADGNEFTSIPLAPLKLKKLNLYSLNNNEITTIDSTIFTNHSIQVLSLNNNLIEYVPSGIFKMKELRSLNLKSNKISYIEKINNVHESSLTTIVLNNNPLGDFPFNLINNLPNIKELHLRNCYISKPPPLHFFTNTFLEKIDLRKNNFILTDDDIVLYSKLKNKNGKKIKIYFDR